MAGIQQHLQMNAKIVRAESTPNRFLLQSARRVLVARILGLMANPHVQFARTENIKLSPRRWCALSAVLANEAIQMQPIGEQKRNRAVPAHQDSRRQTKGRPVVPTVPLGNPRA
jgi:hypothetical protein